MSAPVPHDPRGPSADEIRRAVGEVLAEEGHELAREAEILERAHELLRGALDEPRDEH